MRLPIENEVYTYTDYCQWTEGERWELIDGEAYAMSPAPSWIHQDVSAEILTQLRLFLKDKPCVALAAPFDVRLNPDDGDNTVVQPDLIVVCDRAKLDDNCCNGAPDLVVEILSPSSAKRDRFIKLSAYRRAGVREYWIVDPDTKTVSVHILQDGEYIIRVYDAAIPVHVLEGCEIDLTGVFAE